MNRYFSEHLMIWALVGNSRQTRASAQVVRFVARGAALVRAAFAGALAGRVLPALAAGAGFCASAGTPADDSATDSAIPVAVTRTRFMIFSLFVTFALLKRA
jgi:hypothetical protein